MQPDSRQKLGRKKAQNAQRKNLNLICVFCAFLRQFISYLYHTRSRLKA